MKIGYARVSIQEQDLALQIDALTKEGCEKIFQEKASLVQRDRPELKTALSYMRKGDTLMVWKLDRLARSMKQLIEIIESFQNRGIGLKSLQDPINTSLPSGILVFHIFAALAEFERGVIRERTTAGLRATRERGRVGGRPPSTSAKNLRVVRAMLKDSDITVAAVARRSKLHRLLYTGTYLTQEVQVWKKVWTHEIYANVISGLASWKQPFHKPERYTFLSELLTFEQIVPIPRVSSEITEEISLGTHYVRYHIQKPGNEIISELGRFEAWATKMPKPKKGDIVWLLSGREKAPPGKSYRLEHYFKVDSQARLEGNRWVIQGTEGRIFENGVNIGNEPWFKNFFVGIGKGGISFQVIPEKYLQYFLPLMFAVSEKNILDNAIEEAENAGDDSEVITLKAIKTRRGQATFRKSLLDAYEARCCFTGCSVVEILEAAHISSHSEETNYQISNGLLLRSDIHTLFDLHLVAVDKWNRIRVSKRLKDSEYQRLNGEMITLPNKVAEHPSRFGLARWLEKFDQLEAEAFR